jgi:hypothetical protein
MTDEKREELRVVIGAAVEGEHKTTLYYDGFIVDVITDPDNTRLVMDALVEAGVVEKSAVWGNVPESRFHYYLLAKPKPHVHEPYVRSFNSFERTVVLFCHGCDEFATVPSSLPIEWPDE